MGGSLLLNIKMRHNDFVVSLFGGKVSPGPSGVVYGVVSIVKTLHVKEPSTLVEKSMCIPSLPSLNEDCSKNGGGGGSTTVD